MLGIDLGATTCAVAAVLNGRVDAVANESGNRTTPSLVLFDPTCQEWLVGEAAVSKAPKLQATDAAPPTAVKVLTLLLSQLRSVGEAYTGARATTAVIGVSPRWPREHHDDVQKAAVKAGFRQAVVIPSAVAAAIGHDLDVPSGGKRELVVVVHAGGAALDASLLRVTDGVVEVLGSVSEASVGGGRYDDLLLDFCRAEFQRKFKTEVTGHRALTRLRGACEDAKRSLSTNARVPIEVDSLFDGLDFAVAITRSRMEDICFSVLRNSAKPLETLLSSCGVAASDVHRLVLTGGCSRIPKLREVLSGVFPRTIVVEARQNPEEAVAIGAALQGQWLDDATATATPSVSVLPSAVRVWSPSASACALVLPRLSVLPATGSVRLALPVDAGAASVAVYQGDAGDRGDNRLLCTVPVAAPGAADAASCNVTVSVIALRSGGVRVHCQADGGSTVSVDVAVSSDAAPLALGEPTPVCASDVLAAEAAAAAAADAAAAAAAAAEAAKTGPATTPTPAKAVAAVAAAAATPVASAGAGSGAGAPSAPQAAAAAAATTAATAAATAKAAQSTPPAAAAQRTPAVIAADDLD